MLRSQGLLRTLGNKLNRMSVKNINYKLNVNNNYPVLKHQDETARAHKDLLRILKTMYLNESKSNSDKKRLCSNLKQANKTSSQTIELKDMSAQIEDLQTQADKPQVNTEPSAGATELIHKAKLQMESLNKSFELLISNQLSQRDKITYKQLEFDLKHKKFNSQLKSFVDVCCSSGMLEKAIRHLNSLIENDSNAEHEFVTDVEVFNRVMFELAKHGRTNQITSLFRTMRTSTEPKKQLKPNLGSYAAVIQSIGVQLQKNNLERKLNELRLVLERVLFDIQKSNFSLDDLASKCNLSSEQQFYIGKALNLLLPNFQFKHVPITSLDNPLLDRLKQHKKDIGVVNESVYPREMIDKKLITKNFENQIREEQNLMIRVPSIRNLNKSEMKMKEKYDKIRDVLEREFRESMTRNYLKSIALLKNSTNKNCQFLLPFLTVLEPNVYIDILLKQVSKLAQSSEYFSATVSFYALELGTVLENKYHEFLMVKNNDIEKIRSIYDKYIDYRLSKQQSPSENSNNHREEWMSIMRESNLFKSNIDEQWPNQVRLMVGKYLLEEILFKSCRIDKKLINPNRTVQNQKYEYAFHKIYRLAGVYKDPQVKCHPLLFKVFGSNLLFDSNRMPMVTPPMPWYTSNQGGYFLSKSNLLRLYGESANEQKVLIETTNPQNIYPVYDSLNTLSSCAWKINQPVLDLIIGIFNQDGNKELDVPEPEYKGPDIPRFPNRKLSKQEYKEFYTMIEKAKKKRAEMHSLWCTELYRLSIANMYRDKTIWFPHSLDFRGRCYPIPPHFNHLGSDISRSLILLAEGKKLGPNGLNMLKLHLINLTGLMKKSTLQERINYANSIIDDIVDSAERPMNGRLWWQKSEEKWQTLACCMEIRNALLSGKPEEYVSYFPVHQDGSCNGLQHYAALGRDKDGAVSVNLHPSERPQDVYSSVLDLVEEQRKSEENMNEYAMLLAGNIARKTIKQTVMTTVYNVTFYGAKLQILRQLEDVKNFPQDKAREASAYIAHKTFKSIRQLFTSAREIQDWFSECAYLITRVRDCALKWETPLGLPVSQPYFRRVNIQNSNKNSPSLSTTKPDSLKQRNAFPPNYIHSLDSCHMMLTSLFCEQAGIAFVSVHDCFWTHACSVDQMNRICREQFVALHSLPLLENLSKYFLDNHKFTIQEIENQNDEQMRKLMVAFNEKLQSVPKKGEFDLNKVMDSVYFFS